MSTKFVQMMILGWHLTFLQQGQISVPFAVAVLKECCMASADMQWLFYSGEQIVAHRPLVSYFSTKTYVVGTHYKCLTDVILMSTNWKKKIWLKKSDL